MRNTKAQIIFTFLTIVLTACAPAVAPAPTATLIPTEAAPAFTQTPIPVPVTETAIPTLPHQPPACTFPLPQTTMEESTPEEYTFSEPYVVMTAPSSGLNLIQWLHDNQRALILREVVANQREQDDAIEVFNPITTELQVYAKRKPVSYMLPSWVTGSDGIIYPEFLAEQYAWDADGKVIPPSTDVAHMVLWFTNGNPGAARKIEDAQYNLSALPHEWVISSLVVKPDGSQIVYMKTNGKYLFQFYSRNVSQGVFGKEQLISFDSEMLNYKNYHIIRYEMAWRPNTTQVFLSSSNSDFGAPSQNYSFLFDVSTGKLCEVNFGITTWGKTWATIPRWSPNGRYLAIGRGLGGTPWSDLAALDTKTGDLHTMQFYPQEIQGLQGITGIAWAPDNYHLAVISSVGSYSHCEPNCKKFSRLYLVDLISKKAELLFPSFQFITGERLDSLIWSPDGTKILALCWNEEVSRACLIPVYISRQ